jgi:dihydropteroate synthase
MGVLNVTPDSFSDGGRYFDKDRAIARGLELVAEGADIVDVGGESTRPGAEPVEEAEELRRVLPVVEALARSVRVSIDTMKPAVAEAAVARGAFLINDIACGLRDVAVATKAALVVMHMRGTPKDMQDQAHYDDVVAEVHAFLAERAAEARDAGVKEIYVDPGIGFAKTAEHNVALLAALPELAAGAFPVLLGASRKRFLGTIGRPPGSDPLPVGERSEASLATAVWAMAAGARIVRVHEVRPTVQAARLVGGPRIAARVEVAS